MKYMLYIYILFKVAFIMKYKGFDVFQILFKVSSFFQRQDTE